MESRTSRIVWWLLVAYISSALLIEARLGVRGLDLPNFIGNEGPERGGHPFISEWFILVAVCVTILGRLRSGFSLVPFCEVRLLAGLNAYWAVAVSLSIAIFAVPQSPSASGAARMLAEGFLLFWCASIIEWNSKMAAKVLWCFVGIGVFHASVIVVSYLSPDSLAVSPNILLGETARYAGYFLQPSRAALLLAIASVAALGFSFVLSRSGATKAVSLILLSIIAVALFLTQTRGPLLAAVVGATVLLARSKHLRLIGRRKALPVVLAAVGLVMVLATTGVGELAFERFRNAQVASTAGGVPRERIYRFALEYVLQHPLGGGIGGLEPASGELGIPHAHNMYLQWFAMFGIIGGTLFCLFLLRTIGESRRRAVSAHSAEEQGLRWILLAMLVTLLVALLFEPYLLTNVGGWVWLIAGLMVSQGAYCTLDRSGLMAAPVRADRSAGPSEPDVRLSPHPAQASPCGRRG